MYTKLQLCPRESVILHLGRVKRPLLVKLLNDDDNQKCAKAVNTVGTIWVTGLWLLWKLAKLASSGRLLPLKKLDRRSGFGWNADGDAHAYLWPFLCRCLSSNCVKHFQPRSSRRAADGYLIVQCKVNIVTCAGFSEQRLLRLFLSSGRPGKSGDETRCYSFFCLFFLNYLLVKKKYVKMQAMQQQLNSLENRMTN